MFKFSLATITLLVYMEERIQSVRAVFLLERNCENSLMSLRKNALRSTTKKIEIVKCVQKRRKKKNGNSIENKHKRINFVNSVAIGI